MSGLPEYILEREFAAPRDMVWRVWSDPDLLQHWYGPGVETIIHKFELEPDGVWLNEMKMGENSFFQKVVYQEVVESEKMVWHHCSVDSDWSLAANPMMPNWPRTLLTTVTFETLGDNTIVRLSQIPMNASDAELACFANMMDGMSGGWGKGYEIIDELLVKLQDGTL
jgi:uncharacterized protein YndB with AHSA1/START domain